MSRSYNDLSEISRRNLLLGASAGAALLHLNPKSSFAQTSEEQVPQNILDLLDSTDGVENNFIRKEVFGSTNYYIYEQTNEEYEYAEPVVIKSPADGDPVVLVDFVGLPQLAAAAAATEEEYIDLSLFALPSEYAAATIQPGPTAAAASETVDEKVRNAARDNVGLNSRNARGTNGGRLACAWAVNQVVNLALSAPILDGVQGLATANMVKVLRGKHVKIPSPRAGAIIISPTVYWPKTIVGHVGIVGEDGYSVYSNSSSQAKWVKNFDIDRWNLYYTGTKKLQTEYYRLDDIYFPQPRN